MADIAKETNPSGARLPDSTRKRLGELARKLEEKRRELDESRLLREAEMKALRSEMEGREAKRSEDRASIQRAIADLKEARSQWAEEREGLLGRMDELKENMKELKAKHQEEIEEFDRRRKVEFDEELGEWEAAKEQYEIQVSELEKKEKQAAAEREGLIGRAAELEKNVQELKAKHQEEIEELERRRTAELDDELDELEHLLGEVKTVGPEAPSKEATRTAGDEKQKPA